MREGNCEVGRRQQWQGWKAAARPSREQVLRGRKKGRWEEQWGWRAEVSHSRPETHGVRQHKQPPREKLQKTTSFQVNGRKKGWGLWGARGQLRAAPYNAVGRLGWEWNWMRSEFAPSSLGDMEDWDVNTTLLNLNRDQYCWAALKSYTRNRTLETIHAKPSNGKKETQTRRRLCRCEGTELEFRSSVFQSTDSLDYFLAVWVAESEPPAPTPNLPNTHNWFCTLLGSGLAYAELSGSCRLGANLFLRWSQHKSSSTLFLL